MRPRGRRRWGRAAGRSRTTRPPPSPRLPSDPKREGGMITDPSRSPHFGSGCLATMKPSPANPGRNALQKGRASLGPHLT